MDVKTMFAPKKGKPATKGQKQIEDENRKTIRNYSIAIGVTLITQFLFTSTLLSVFAFLVQGGCLSAMYFMAPTIDLNLKGGFADYLIDIIITTCACSLLSIFSSKFFFLWIWLPIYFIYKIWVGLIAPWIFAPAPEPPANNEKKKRKMERKMARAGNR